MIDCVEVVSHVPFTGLPNNVQSDLIYEDLSWKYSWITTLYNIFAIPYLLRTSALGPLHCCTFTHHHLDPATFSPKMDGVNTDKYERTWSAGRRMCVQ